MLYSMLLLLLLISIHIPRAGDDKISFRHAELRANISIHIPRAGDDQQLADCNKQ